MQIAFTPGKGFVAWLIKLWTGGPYCHCEIIFGDGAWFGSSIDKPYKVEYHRTRLWELEWDMVNIPVTFKEETEIRVWCDGQVGAEYDWSGIVLSQALRLGGHSRRRWFCSELCLAAIQKIGILPDIKPHTVSPNKLARLLRMQPEV